MSIRKYSKIAGITICLAALLAYGVIHNIHSYVPTVKNGVLDLTGWEIAGKGKLVLDTALAVYLLVISVYYLSIYVLRRDSKECLYFSIGCILVMTKQLVSGGYFIFSFFPNFCYWLSVFLFYISVYWGVFMFLAFISSLYPHRWSKKVIRVYAIMAALFTLFSIAAPFQTFTAAILAFNLINFAGLLYILIVISRAAYRGLSGARVIIWGVFAMALAAAHDILKFANIIHSPFDYLTAFGVVILIFLNSAVITSGLLQEYKQLKDLTIRLESANKLKDEFLTNTSHELRTPVNAIIAITESIVKDSQAAVGEKEKEDLMHVVSSGRRLVNLINDILDYSRLKLGDLTLVKKVFSMDSLIQGVIREISFMAADKGINIVYKHGEAKPQVYADEYRITQVLYNLLGNAVKFTGSGGSIIVSAFSDNDTVYVSVTDTGIGIPEDKIGGIFETFRQADASITRKYGGMGLGLSISRSIIHAHDREIQVTSRVGEGSEFIFGVPAAKTDATRDAEPSGGHYNYPPVTAYEQRRSLAVKGSIKGSIFVIDDSYDNLIGVINILRADGYTLKGFTDPRKALGEIFEDTETLVAIIDVMMPELSGYDVCGKIRERFSLLELPVLLLTAGTSIESIVKGFDAGANDFLKKPFDGEELKARIKTLYNLKYATEKALSSETAFLQAQIKPHFLYNSINTIIASCHTDAGKAADMLLDLSDYLRHLFDFNSEEKLIPLKRELEGVKAYLSLEKARFAGSFEYSVELEDYENMLIPPMLIQPLVENAVRHGLRKVERAGRVTIRGGRTGDFYTIVVEDNGAGISKRDLEKILRGEKKEGTGTGLMNVRKRLKVFYGTDIEMESVPGEGTRVYVRVKAG